MADTEKVIDKIRKLHAHAQSAEKIGSEQEAQAFAQMVNRLLNQHRLELTDIQFEEQRKNEPVTQAEIDFRKYGDTHRGKKVEWKHKSVRVEWIEKLAGVVAGAHSCQILVVEKSNRLFLCGTETNRQIAEYVLITLMRVAEKLSWDEYAKFFYRSRDEGDVTRARGFRHAWLIGFISRIAERFDEEKRKMQGDTTGTALVRYDREKADVQDFLKNATRAKNLPVKTAHNIHGIIAGRKKADDMNLDANAVREGRDQKQLGISYYIVESPSRGVVMEITGADPDGPGAYRCSYNAKRTDGLKFTLERAETVQRDIHGSYVLKVTEKPKFSITHLDGRQA